MLRLQMGVWGASPRASLGSFMKATRAAASWSGSRIFTVLGRRFSRKALKLTWSWSPDLVTGIRLPAISMYCGLPSKTCWKKVQWQEVMLLSCSGSNMGHMYLYVLQPFFPKPIKGKHSNRRSCYCPMVGRTRDMHFNAIIHLALFGTGSDSFGKHSNTCIETCA